MGKKHYSPGQGGIGILGFLELRSAKQLFDVLCRAHERYRSTRQKQIEDVFLLVFGLVHMREWIAPGYSGGTPRAAADRFSQALYGLPEYDILRRFANQGKHQQISNNDLPMPQGTHYGLVDDAESIDDLIDFDAGPLVAHTIEGREVAVLFAHVLEFYRQRWFSLPFEEQLK